MANEVAEEYLSSLTDLTVNSKPLINMLTMLAEENSSYAPSIVQAIESHIEKVSPDVKLPILYLIDSIVKNVAAVYVPLFTNNIVQIFASVFEKVDEKTRMCMFKLRQTWNDHFPAKKMYTLDLRIQHIDQNWPISSPPPTSIHVNPKFLNKNVASNDVTKAVTPPLGAAVLSTEHEATIFKKQQILQELQQKKRELELIQQKVLFGDPLPQAIVRPVVHDEPTSLLASRHINVSKPPPKAVVIPANPTSDQAAAPKTKIAPANSILIAAARSRDPRLARMQAAKKAEPLKNNDSEPREKKSSLKHKHADDPVDEILRKQKSSALKTTPKKVEKEVPEAKITEDLIQQRQMAMLKAPVLGQINRKGEVEKPRRRQYSPTRKSSRDRRESPKSSDKDSPGKSKNYRDTKSKRKTRDKVSRSDNKSEENKPDRRRGKNEKRDDKDDVRVPEIIEASHPTNNGIKDPRCSKDRPVVVTSPEPPPPPSIGPQENLVVEDMEIEEDDMQVVSPRDEAVAFKAVKAVKGRHYSRRNKERSVTPPSAIVEPTQPEEGNRQVLKSTSEEVVDVGKDVDLRLLMIGNAKKRTSTDGNLDGPPSKRGKDDDTIQLFGNKDMDERLPPGGVRTPPPPVISDVSPAHSPSLREVRSAEEEVTVESVEHKAVAVVDQEKLGGLLSKRIGSDADKAKLLDEFIVTAKDQLKRGIITPVQYNQIMQQVVQTTEDEKIKIAQKRRDSFLKTNENDSFGRIPRPNFPGSDFRHKGPWRPEEEGGPFGRRWRGRGGFGPRGRMPEPHWRERDNRFKPGGNSPDWMDTDSRSQDAWMNVGDVMIPPADPHLVDAATDPMRHISIDGTNRAIRFYGNLAVVMLSFNNAREISFENGVRRVFIAGLKIPCQFNGPPMPFLFQKNTHKVRLGAPTRELYVDDLFYEVQFGGPPIQAELAGVPCTVQLDGPPPQVRISPNRNNLCLGSVLLIVDARSSFPIYLDAKPQRFSINGRPLVLQFSKKLALVLINGVTVPLQFGGSPVPILFCDRQHFLRLTELPHGIVPGRATIQGMDMDVGGSPYHQDNNSADGPLELAITAVAPVNEPPRGVYTDLVSSMMGDSPEAEQKVGFNYKIESEQELLAQPTPAPAAAPLPSVEGDAPAAGVPLLQSLNITDLFQSLVASGIIPKQADPAPQPAKEEAMLETNFPPLKSITFDSTNSLKTKQPGAHAALYSGIQCGSCGIRFHPNETQKYSQHLDWHFRQNRKGRDALRHGSCRRWYYNIQDWKDFNEIEELEDRAQSWFETEALNQGGEAVEDEVQPSETAPRGGGSVSCNVCQDRFDTFFHEDTEEWHLKNCISIDARYYHPACYKDALELSETDHILGPPMLEPLKEEKVKMEESVVVLEVEDDDPDEMDDIEVVTADEEDIRNVVNQLVERVIMEEECDASPLEDDELEVLAVTNTYETREPIAFIEIDDNGDDEEYSPDAPLLFDPNRKIKMEPVEDMESAVAQVDQTLNNVVSSIDGNIEMSEAPVAPASAPSRIKITFTKPPPLAPEPIPDIVEEPIDPSELQIEEIVSEPLPIKPKKPRIAEKVMKEYPPCKRGTEMSGLCSIM